MENRTTVEPNVEQAMEYICQHDYTNKAKEIVIKCVEAVVRNYYENPDDSRNEECFNVFLNILGFDIAECDFPKKPLCPSAPPSPATIVLMLNATTEKIRLVFIRKQFSRLWNIKMLC